MLNITEMRCKEACNSLKNKDGLPYDWQMNVYRGCTHGCYYCYAVYSHDYLNGKDPAKSPYQSFAQDIHVKVNIVEQLERQLSSPNWKREVIGIGGVTDSYQAMEAKYKLMPEILKLLIKYQTPCSISTKSDLILRDYDLIDELSRITDVSISASITCMDETLRRKLEPGGKSTIKRFKMLKEFSKTNAKTGMLQMPIIPFMTDSFENIDQLYAHAAEAHVDYIVPGFLYLRGKTRGVFYDFIKHEFPDLFQPLMQFFQKNNLATKAYKSSVYKMIYELKRKYRLSSYTPPKKEKRASQPEGPIQLSLFDVSPSTNDSSTAIPSREQLADHNTQQQVKQQNTKVINDFNPDPFVEIEMGQTSTTPSHQPFPTKELQSQPVETTTCERRAKFYSMRQIARNTLTFQIDETEIFYKQAQFMADFEDDYTEVVPFSSYFSYYQRMKHEQLRTYFTWRTQVRKGIINPISVSYAFLYIYELINQIGVTDPEDGLNKLTTFWQTFRTYDPVLDQYVLHWLKDYHVYYPLPHTFRHFVNEHQLITHYPSIFGYNSGEQESFDLFTSISKYDIKQSVYYTNETHDILQKCFHFILKKFRKKFQQQNTSFEDLVFHPIAKQIRWLPFNQALFYPVLKQSDRQVILSERESYQLKNNAWRYQTASLTEHGKQLIGYLMKEMESSLRKITKFKYKITANPKGCGDKTLKILESVGIEFPQFIEDSVQAFYQERTRIEISVNPSNISQIREEALQIQEKLIVLEEEHDLKFNTQEKELEQEPTTILTAQTSNVWVLFKESLTEIELEALKIILTDNDIKIFAMKHMIMLEVLVDGINDKAMDLIGDTILELGEQPYIHEEYTTNITEIM